MKWVLITPLWTFIIHILLTLSQLQSLSHAYKHNHAGINKKKISSFQYLSSHCIIIASSCKGSAQLCNFSGGFVNGNYIPETSLKQNLNSQKTKSLFIMSKFSAVESKATTGISVSIGTSMYSFQEICKRAKLILVHMTLSIKIHVHWFSIGTNDSITAVITVQL